MSLSRALVPHWARVHCVGWPHVARRRDRVSCIRPRRIAPRRVYVGGIPPGAYINPQRSWTAGQVSCSRPWHVQQTSLARPQRQRSSDLLLMRGAASTPKRALGRVCWTCTCSDTSAGPEPNYRFNQMCARALGWPQARVFLVDNMMMAPDANIMSRVALPGLTIASALANMDNQVRWRTRASTFLHLDAGCSAPQASSRRTRARRFAAARRCAAACTQTAGTMLELIEADPFLKRYASEVDRAATLFVRER